MSAIPPLLPADLQAEYTASQRRRPPLQCPASRRTLGRHRPNDPARALLLHHSSPSGALCDQETGQLHWWVKYTLHHNDIIGWVNYCPVHFSGIRIAAILSPPFSLFFNCHTPCLNPHSVSCTTYSIPPYSIPIPHAPSLFSSSVFHTSFSHLQLSYSIFHFPFSIPSYMLLLRSSIPPPPPSQTTSPTFKCTWQFCSCCVTLPWTCGTPSASRSSPSCNSTPATWWTSPAPPAGRASFYGFSPLLNSCRLAISLSLSLSLPLSPLSLTLSSLSLSHSLSLLSLSLSLSLSSLSLSLSLSPSGGCRGSGPSLLNHIQEATGTEHHERGQDGGGR